MFSLLRKSPYFLFLFILPVFSFAQETTATLSGRVTDANGAMVDGASIMAVYEPTNTRAATQTNAKDIFVLPNLKPGGPYTITISFIGYDEQKVDNVTLGLGNNPDVTVQLKNSEKNLVEVVINATRHPATGMSIGRTQLSGLPTSYKRHSQVYPRYTQRVLRHHLWICEFLEWPLGIQPRY